MRKRFVISTLLAVLATACASAPRHPVPDVSAADMQADVLPILTVVAEFHAAIDGVDCAVIPESDNRGRYRVACDAAGDARLCLPRTNRSCVAGFEGIDFRFSGYRSAAKDRAVVVGAFRRRAEDALTGLILEFARDPNGQWSLVDSDWSVEILV